MQEILGAEGGTCHVEAGTDRATLRLSLPVQERIGVLVVDDNPDLVHFYRRYTAGELGVERFVNALRASPRRSTLRLVSLLVDQSRRGDPSADDRFHRLYVELADEVGGHFEQAVALGRLAQQQMESGEHVAALNSLNRASTVARQHPRVRESDRFH